MYIDAFTVSALVDEFLDLLAGGRVQDSIDVDETGLGLEIYAGHRRRYLYLSADTHTPRVHLVPDKLRRGVTRPSNLGLLFRRYVEGGVIEHVSQPPWERILQIDISGPEGPVTIVAEPMERRSNLLLLQHGIILDCIRRVGPSENRYRVSLPNHEYVLPPPQAGKLDPTRLMLEDVVGLLEQVNDPKRKTQQALTAGLLGISPLLAREIVFRASGNVDERAADAVPEALYDALVAVVGPLGRREWRPGVVEGDTGVQAFSVYPVEHLPGWKSADGISEAISLYFGGAIGEDAYNAAKGPVREALDEAQAKLRARLVSLERSVTDDSEREQLRQSGELILAYQYALLPGQTELRAQYDPDQPELIIALDPKQTPLENAQRYFDRYNRAKRALEDVPALIEETRRELEYLNQLRTDLDLASNWPEIDEVQQILQAKGYWRGKPRARIAGGGQSTPLRIVTKDGFVIWIGRNSRQNEIVTFDKGNPQDLWLHARDAAGAHVIIRNDGRAIPEGVITAAAALAAHFSANRNESAVIVDVTRRKHVRRIKGGATGMVTYRNEETRTVAPQSQSDLEAAGLL